MGKRLLFTCTCALLTTAALTAQEIRAVASFDRSRAEAGDTVMLRVQVAGIRSAPQRVQVAAWMPTIPAEHFRMRSPWRRSGESWVQDLSLLFLDTGHFRLPSLPVLLQVGDPVMTNPLDIAVTAPAVPTDTSAMAPLREVRPPEATSSVLWWAIAGGAALAVAIALVWRRWRQKRPAPAPASPPPPLPSAHDIARERLERLARQKPWKLPHRVIEYYAELSWIVREYLGAQYQFPALELTTDQICRHLSASLLPPDQQAEVQRLLQQADWVKFAHALPKADQHERWLATAQRICSATA